ncbi:UTP--glucose-1-phosphate uridylyltransferase [Pycnococcus provasolii]
MPLDNNVLAPPPGVMTASTSRDYLPPETDSSLEVTSHLPSSSMSLSASLSSLSLSLDISKSADVDGDGEEPEEQSMSASSAPPVTDGRGGSNVVEKTPVPGFDLFRLKMRKEDCSTASIAAFENNYKSLVNGETGMIPEDAITPASGLPTYESTRGAAARLPGKGIAELLSQTAVVKLNGGLGTSMGLEKAKSLLPVRGNDTTFLDLIGRQVEHMRKQHGAPNLKFLLMNSFSTSDDTKEFFGGRFPQLQWTELMQNMSPKIDKATKKPAVFEENPKLEWCPPGHGDIYPALLGTGTLDRLLEDGVKYLFVSNSDNLGATLDLDLLAYFANESGAPFLMEVCERTESDKKGGHLAVSNATNGLILRESAQCPKEDEGSFQDVTKHRFFNTNNLWVNLVHLKATMSKHGGLLPLPTIFNEKTVDPRNKKTPKVYQLETAMGSAIACFDKAGAVCVPRTRFAPVKTCADLLVLRSDAYTTLPDSRVQLTPGVAKSPVVKLDDDHYKLVDKLDALVEAAPSLSACTKLTVQGPVRFVAGTTLKGSCRIVNHGADAVTLPPKTYVDCDIDLTASATATADNDAAVPSKARATGCFGCLFR